MGLDGCVINYNLEEYNNHGWKVNNLPKQEVVEPVDSEEIDGPCTETVYETWAPEITSVTKTRTLSTLALGLL